MTNRRRPRLPAAAATIAMSALLSLLVAGCGGGSSTTAVTTATQNGALAFARCMRSHGFPRWPDPETNGVFDKTKLLQLDYNEARVRAVEGGACNHLLAAGGGGPQDTAAQTRTRFADALAFANCMRDRGFQNFPDPTAQGAADPQMVTAAGIDLHQRALLRAGLACVPVTHGRLTRASIERAVNGG